MTNLSSSNQTLLPPDVCQGFRSAWRDLANELLLRERSGLHSKLGPGLMSGKSGLALFFAHASNEAESSEFEDAAIQNLQSSIEQLKSGLHSHTLGHGFLGPAWVISHLNGWFISTDDDVLLEVDNAIIEYLNTKSGIEDYDLISGWAGIGVYALSRFPHPSSLIILGKIIEKLSAYAMRSAEGITWFTPPELLPAWMRKDLPNGYFNLGVAHGVPGVIALLGQIWSVGYRHPALAELIDGSITWLLARGEFNESASCFKAYELLHSQAAIIPDARNGWCYGDPGISVALLSASRHYERRDWEEEAIKIGLSAATRPLAQKDLLVPYFCHGTVGTAHLFYRLFQATELPEFASAANKYYTETIHHLYRNSLIRGIDFVDDSLSQSSETSWKDDSTFLNGIAGIGLCLLTVSSLSMFKWDDVLLASVPRVRPPSNYHKHFKH